MTIEELFAKVMQAWHSVITADCDGIGGQISMAWHEDTNSNALTETGPSTLL